MFNVFPHQTSLHCPGYSFRVDQALAHVPVALALYCSLSLIQNHQEDLSAASQALLMALPLSASSLVRLIALLNFLLSVSHLKFKVWVQLNSLYSHLKFQMTEVKMNEFQTLWTENLLVFRLLGRTEIKTDTKSDCTCGSVTEASREVEMALVLLKVFVKAQGFEMTRPTR